MTLDDYVANYLRDGQYRIAQLSVEMNQMEDQGSYQYKKLFESRLSIAAFMDILYEGKWLISNGYSHMQIGEGLTWTEREVISEIEYIRYFNKMNEVPYITFTAHYPKIASTISGGGTGSGTSTLPTGNYGQLMGFDGSGAPEAQNISPWAGHNDESISNYFTR